MALEPLTLTPGLCEAPAPVGFFALLDDVGVGEADFATVTVGPLTVAVSGEPLPSGTETVAVNLIVSPAGAVFGTLTEASICGAEGCAAGRVRSQLVFVGLLAQLSTVNTGWLKVGLFALGVRVVAIVPFSAELDQAEMRNRTVPPACTLVPEAVTATAGFVGVGVAVGVGFGVGVGVAVGVALAAGDDAAGDGDALVEAVALFVALTVALFVALTAGADEVAAAVGDAAVGDAAA